MYATQYSVYTIRVWFMNFKWNNRDSRDLGYVPQLLELYQWQNTIL